MISSGRLTWVIDPIDGTKSFITGMPLFGTLIALVSGGRPIVGVIDMPALGERWCGTGDAAWFDGRPARTSGRHLHEARLFATSPDIFGGTDAEAFARLSRAVGLRRFGGGLLCIRPSRQRSLRPRGGSRAPGLRRHGPRAGGGRGGRGDDRLGRSPPDPGFRRTGRGRGQCRPPRRGPPALASLIPAPVFPRSSWYTRCQIHEGRYR